jgi:hypothetical protein
MQTRINKKQVSHLVISGLIKTKYVWRPEKIEKHFFGLFKDVYKAGYYYKGLDSFEVDYSKIEDDMTDIDGVLHYLPSVTVFSGGKEILEEIFDDVETAREWATKNFPNCEIVER